MFERIFNFIDDAETYEERKVAYFNDGDLHISTVEVRDGRLPFETGVAHPEYNNGKWVIVDVYKTREEARIGHEGWIKAMTEDELPEALLDVANSEIAQVLIHRGVKLLFPRGNRRIQ